MSLHEAPYQTSRGEITDLLGDLRRGDRSAMDRLIPLVYEHLRLRARWELARVGRRRLDTTSLVHEAYLKLAHAPGLSWEDRRHFLNAAAKAMRCVLVDAARRRSADKRGGGAGCLSLDQVELPIDAEAAELLELDQALDQLAEIDARLSQVVELRFFAGLSVEQTAELLDVSSRTVKRQWRKARAILYRALHG